MSDTFVLQHMTLIFHIKQKHNLEKPHLCTQCNKAFNRRSDLRKHTFVHAGRKLFIVKLFELLVSIETIRKLLHHQPMLLFSPQEFVSTFALSATNPSPGTQTSPNTSGHTLKVRKRGSASCVLPLFSPIQISRTISRFTWTVTRWCVSSAIRHSRGAINLSSIKRLIWCRTRQLCSTITIHRSS